MKKTKRGAVIKIVREHYLRDDIWCGSELCELCQQESPILQREPHIDSALCNFPHYILPDTNVLLHQVNSDFIAFFLSNNEQQNHLEIHHGTDHVHCVVRNL